MLHFVYLRDLFKKSKCKLKIWLGVNQSSHNHDTLTGVGSEARYVKRLRERDTCAKFLTARS